MQVEWSAYTSVDDWGSRKSPASKDSQFYRICIPTDVCGFHWKTASLKKNRWIAEFARKHFFEFACLNKKSVIKCLIVIITTIIIIIIIIIIIVITIIIIIIIIIKTSRKYQREPLWQRFKRSACWDLRESSERCSVYEQKDWLEWLTL